jgi:hypothetical protein
LDYLTTHTSLSPIRRGFGPRFVNYKKGCTRLASDKAYQLLAHGRWFSPGTPASYTTKTGRHDIAEICVKTPKIKINQSFRNTHEFTPRFLVSSCCSIFSFLCSVLYIIVCPFSLSHCVVCPSLNYGF